MRLPLVAGNWKMFKTRAEAREFAEAFKSLYGKTDVRAAVIGPYTALETLVEAFRGTAVAVGAQNVHFEKEGAFTGEISIPMLEDIGVDYCIIGHSERRQYYNETDDTVNLKLRALLASSILPILCVGENLEQRDAAMAFEIVEAQLRRAFGGVHKAAAARTVIAYEPVWAIGTGRNATPEQADEMCGYIRDVLESLYDDETADKVVIQYGGSVKPANATELLSMPEIDGALVGGASLSPRDFMDIIEF